MSWRGLGSTGQSTDPEVITEWMRLWHPLHLPCQHLRTLLRVPWWLPSPHLALSALDVGLALGTFRAVSLQTIHRDTAGV